ncbi:MAG: thiamine-phosphate kinase [Pseudomonadota bacterium]
MASEFEIIERYFTLPSPGAVLGVGDDAALVRAGHGMDLAVATDMLVAGRHFPLDTDPERLGHKALAVNLSDLAAMGAQPRWALLALALPEADEDWLAAFARGFAALAAQHGVELVGGDTTHGPLNLCVTVMGEVPAGAALRRDGAKAGDDVWVSGTLGDAALALANLQQRVELLPHEAAALMPRLETPQPRVALGIALRGIAHSAIDVSDGLAADLGHVLKRSGVAATVEAARLPLSEALRVRGARPELMAWVLAGGDDYELCFTAPPGVREVIDDLGRELSVPVSRIGAIESGAGLTVLDGGGRPLQLQKAGFDHFG